MKKFLKNPLFLAQMTAHISIIPMIFYAEISHYFISLLVYFLTGCIGLSTTYHRLLSHRSFKAPKWFEIFGTLLGSLGLVGSSLSWCSVHREHHRHSDKKSDPHSPHFKKWWTVQFFSMFYKPNLKFMEEKLKCSFHRSCHKNYFQINILYALTLFSLDPFSVIYAYLFPSAVLWNLGSLINSLGHTKGYRHFNTRDKSQNNLLLAFLVFGEGWHNNHHKNPGKYYFGSKWFEIDIAGALIWLCFIYSKKFKFGKLK